VVQVLEFDSQRRADASEISAFRRGRPQQGFDPLMRECDGEGVGVTCYPVGVTTQQRGVTSTVMIA